MLKRIKSLFNENVGGSKGDTEKLTHASSQENDEFSHIATSLSAPLLSSDSENDESNSIDGAAAFLQEFDEAGAQDNTPIKSKSPAMKPLPNQAHGYIQSLETVQSENRSKIKLKTLEYWEYCKAHPAKAAGCALAGTVVATVSAAAVVSTGGLAAGAILVGTAGTELTLASAASGGIALATGGATALGAVATDAVLAAAGAAVGWLGAKKTVKAIIPKQDVIDFKEVQAAAALMGSEAELLLSENSTPLDNSDIPLNTLQTHQYDSLSQVLPAKESTFITTYSADDAARSIIELCLTESSLVQGRIARPSFTQILQDKGKEVKKLLQKYVDDLSHTEENVQQNIAQLVSIIVELVSGTLSAEQLASFNINKHDQAKIRDIFFSVDFYNEQKILSYLYPEDSLKQNALIRLIEPYDEASKMISRIATNAEHYVAGADFISSHESGQENDQSQSLGLNDDFKET